MSSIYDMDEPLPSWEERNAMMEAAVVEAERIWRTRKKWALYLSVGSIGAFAAAIPFQAGYRFESGNLFQVFMTLWLILFIPDTVCLALLWPAWQVVRNVKKKAKEVSEEGS